MINTDSLVLHFGPKPRAHKQDGREISNDLWLGKNRPGWCGKPMVRMLADPVLSQSYITQLCSPHRAQGSWGRLSGRNHSQLSGRQHWALGSCPPCRGETSRGQGPGHQWQAHNMPSWGTHPKELGEGGPAWASEHQLHPLIPWLKPQLHEVHLALFVMPWVPWAILQHWPLPPVSESHLTRSSFIPGV